MHCLTTPKCLLDSDSDLLRLSMLASSIGMERVNIFVSELQESKDEDKEDDGDELVEDNMVLVDYEGTDIETDLLPQFCSHNKTILLSSG